MRDRHTKLLVAIGASAVLVVGAVAVILAIGIRHVPDYPTVTEQPDPAVSGLLAYVRWDEQERQMCLLVQDIGGEARSLACGYDEGMIDLGEGGTEFYPQWFGWDDEGHLLVAQYQPDRPDVVVLVTLDVDTGVELAREELPTSTRPPDTSRREDGARVGTTWSEDGTAEVWVTEPGLERRVLFGDRGPDGYAFWNAQWSMRGDFVLVQDSEGRTIVLAVEGDPTPRVLLRDTDQQVAWYQPS